MGQYLLQDSPLPNIYIYIYIYCPWRTNLQWAKASSSLSRLHDHTQTHSHSVGLLWTSDQPDTETSTRQHTTLNGQTLIPPAGFEPAIPASKSSQTHALDRTATGTGMWVITVTWPLRRHTRVSLVVCGKNDKMAARWAYEECFNSSVGPSGVSRNFFSGGSTNSVEDRGQRERGSGGGSPLIWRQL